MHELDPQLVRHKLNIKSGTMLVKQTPRNFIRAQGANQIRNQKALRCWFHQADPALDLARQYIEEEEWQIQYCIHFRDLNKACSKDEFPLPNIDMLVDTTTGHSMFSFVDRFSSYNQIKIDPSDTKKTTFRTPIVNFHYTIMLFGLKNVGVIYQ